MDNARNQKLKFQGDVEDIAHLIYNLRKQNMPFRSAGVRRAREELEASLQRLIRSIEQEVDA